MRARLAEFNVTQPATRLSLAMAEDLLAAFDEARASLRETKEKARQAAQTLIAEVGADGPTDVDAAAERAAGVIRSLRAAQEESEHQMHMRIRAGYDRTVADAWRKKVEEVEDQRNTLRSEVDKLRHERRQLRRRLVECHPWVGRTPYLNTPGFYEMIACRDLAKDTLDEVKE